MSKRAVFTNVTALPSGISRETVMSTFYSHTDIIDLQPMVQSRVPCKPPPKASPEESTAAWYELIDKVHYLPGGLYSGKVKYYVCFHDLTDGIQTHVYAPAGLEIKAKWTLGGTLPGELRGPTELGLGLPKEGLYVREDVDMKCNFMLISFVKKNMQKAHKTLVDRLIEKSHTKERDVYNQRLTIGNAAQVQSSTTHYPTPVGAYSFGSSSSSPSGAAPSSSPSGAAPGRTSMMSNNSSENNTYASTSYHVAEIDGRTVEITPANDQSSSSSTYNRDSKHTYEYDGGDVHPAMRPQSSEPPPPVYQPPARHSPYHQQGAFPPQQSYAQEQQQHAGYGEYAQYPPAPLHPHSHSPSQPQTMQYPPQQYPAGYMQQQNQQQQDSQYHQHHRSTSGTGSHGYGHVRSHSQEQSQSQAPPQPKYAYQWGGMQISPEKMQEQQMHYAQYQREQQQQQQQQQQYQNQPQYHNQPQHQQQQQQQQHYAAQHTQPSQSQLLPAQTDPAHRSRPSSAAGSRTQSPQQRYESAWLRYSHVDSTMEGDHPSTVPNVKKDGDAELPA